VDQRRADVNTDCPARLLPYIEMMRCNIAVLDLLRCGNMNGSAK
jgi:hypothetical protein